MRHLIQQLNKTCIEAHSGSLSKSQNLHKILL